NKLKNIVKNLENINVSLSFFSLNKLGCFIHANKDRLSNMQKRNIVYKINCNDCNASYVGQTKRTLKTRVAEHKNDIRRTNGNLSVISEHRLNFNHDFDWKNVEIVDSDCERWLYRRLIAEMLHIKLQNNSLNLQLDTELLHQAYIPILNNLK
ncbi:hypothetical protein ALC62_15634, partial [Cyphomyrmex costatus]